jgi:hypothetical protein
MEKMTEDEVIDFLASWLSDKGWEILEKCKGHEHGNDILAKKEGQTLMIEAKGAKGSDKSNVTKRAQFDSGQVKIHLGEAMVKVLEFRNKNPGAKIGIAQPEDPYIRNVLKSVIPEVKKIGIVLYWVSSSTGIIEELE